MDYTNEDARRMIEQHIHNARHRKVLTLSLVDGLSYKAIADETDYSERHIGNIVRRGRALFAEKLKAENE